MATVPDLPSQQIAEPFEIPSDRELFRTIVESKTLHGAGHNVWKNSSKAADGKIYEKSTLASRMQATFVKEDSLSRTDALYSTFPLVGSTTVADAFIRRRTTETAAEFLAKKREIFLVQMSLDTKRSEICKLEERAQQRENALKRSEDMLDEDAMKFDAFLKENDNQVQQALKQADNEAKRKQEKVAEIKQLNSEIMTVRSEVNKFEEQMEDFLQYKKFLDSVTPTEWFAEQQAKRDGRKEAKLEFWKKQCEEIKKRKNDAACSKTKAEQEYNNARTQQEAEIAEKRLKEAIEHLKASKLLKEPIKPTDEELESTQVEEETYFKTPQQLLDHYCALEEQNLFLIQNLQDTEEALDKNRGALVEARRNMDAESTLLKEEMSKLKGLRQIKQQRHRNENHLHSFRASALTSSGHTPRVLWDDLESKLKEVYVQCGFVADRSIGMLAMLTNIEMKLEYCLRKVSELPKDAFERSERSREKERRQQYREEKQAEQQKEHEARVKRAQQRAEAPAFKKTGKPEMFRSIIPARKKTTKHKARQDDTFELKEFLSKELI